RRSYCRCTSSTTARTSTPSGRRAASAFSDTGSAEAKRIASAMRTASAMSKGKAEEASSPSISNGMIFALLSLIGRLAVASGFRLATAHVDRCEGAVLPHFQQALADHFEAGGKGAGDRGHALLGRRHSANVQMVERGPVLHLA